jgi:hypothetical protein
MGRPPRAHGVYALSRYFQADVFNLMGTLRLAW